MIEGVRLGSQLGRQGNGVLCLGTVSQEVGEGVDGIAHCHLGYCRTHLTDNPRQLMAGDDGQRANSPGTRLPSKFHGRDADRIDTHQHLSFPRSRWWDVFIDQPLWPSWGMNADSFHNVLLLLIRIHGRWACVSLEMPRPPHDDH